MKSEREKAAAKCPCGCNGKRGQCRWMCPSGCGNTLDAKGDAECAECRNREDTPSLQDRFGAEFDAYFGGEY